MVLKFSYLRKALENCSKDKIIVAEDIDASGKKRFYAETVSDLALLYSRLRQHHWYECLQEDRPTRLFLDVESNGQVDIKAIVRILSIMVKVFIKANNGTFKTPIFQVLDSSSSTKTSYHIICTNLYLKNVYHVGAFVRRCVLTMLQKNIESGSIDTGVYTLNRMFRVNGSTKFGSERCLKHDLPWTELLVQSPSPEHLDVYCCNEMDQSTPRSTSSAPEDLFEHDGERWISKRKISVMSATINTECLLLEPILDFLDHTLQADLNRYDQKMTEDGAVMVNSGSKCCQIAQRTHNGNHIWFRIDIIKQTVCQCCYDNDCKEKRPFLVNIPKTCWDKWNDEWNKKLELI